MKNDVSQPVDGSISVKEEHDVLVANQCEEQEGAFSNVINSPHLFCSQAFLCCKTISSCISYFCHFFHRFTMKWKATISHRQSKHSFHLVFWMILCILGPSFQFRCIVPYFLQISIEPPSLHRLNIIVSCSLHLSFNPSTSPQAYTVLVNRSSIFFLSISLLSTKYFLFLPTYVMPFGRLNNSV